MILGMSLSAFTTLHVVISLIAIASGIIVMFGLLGSNRMPGLTAIFLLFTILTSATGFLFPFEKLLPSHMVGILSLVLLAIACLALYVMKLSGAWRWIYVLTALASLYFNVFVLVIQSFLKVPALTALAPGNPPSGPVFVVLEGVDFFAPVRDSTSVTVGLVFYAGGLQICMQYDSRTITETQAGDLLATYLRTIRTSPDMAKQGAQAKAA
jgi:hypothetical protein